MNRDFWTNKTVLVTGHTGFKGSWLVKWLDMLGASVIGFSKTTEKESGFNGLSFSDRFINLVGDIRKKKDVEIIRKYKPNVVFHLAAQAIVGKAIESPAYTFETNLMGTVNLLEMLRSVESVESIVVVTSDKVYKNRETVEGYVESDSLMGSEPYSCSKVCQEQATKAYYESFFKNQGVGVATVRASNLFGGGDYHFNRLVPYLQQCANQGVIPEIRNAQSVRPWQYVLNVLSGYLTIAQRLYEENDKYSGEYNFGPSRKELYRVGDIADIVCGKLTETEKQDYYEAGLLFIDSQKSNEMLGWKPIMSVVEGMEETNAAYKQYFCKSNSNDIYESRIVSFEKRMKRIV